MNRTETVPVERSAVVLDWRGMEHYLRPYLTRVWERKYTLLIVIVLYVAVAQFSSYLYRGVGTSPSVILAPSGIALAAIILEGYIVLPAIAVGALINGMLLGTPLLLLLGSILGNTFQTFSGYYILERLGFDRLLSRIQDMFLLIATALINTMIVPTINFLTISLQNTLFDETRAVTWLMWWLGGVLSTLVVTTFLIRWVRRPFITERSVGRYIEIAIALLSLTVTSIFLFGTPYTSVFGISLLFVVFIPLFWLAFRGGPRFMTLGLFVFTIISFIGAIYGTHAPSSTITTMSQRIFNVEVFDICIVLFFFILVSLEEQRGVAHRALGAHARKLEDAMEQIRQNDSAKNEFIATLGHELRNPLASILSSVELLKMSPKDKEERETLLTSVSDRVHTMGRLLDDILDISRIREKKFILKKEQIDVRDVAQSAVAVIEPFMKKRGHIFAADIPETPILLDADPARIEQIMVNLLHNAAKYTPAAGRIDLSVKSSDTALNITVRDTGIGIPEEMIKRIFDPFVQISPKLKREHGIGLGLSLTKNLVEMHGGTISVQSRENRGSEFTVSIPLPPQPLVQRRSPVRSEAAPKLGALRILVVDDNAEAARSLGKLLTLRGHSITLAENGESTLDMAPSLKPDAIILDIGLPDMDGYEVARALRRGGLRSAIIALTGYGQESDKAKAKEAGFDTHLTKPIGLADLEKALADAIDIRS